MKKIAITGLDGFLSGYCIEEAQKRGYQVVGNLRHTSKNPLLADCEIYFTDIRDSAGVYGMIEHCDGVIHLAGLLGTTENIRQAELLNETNIGGTLNVLNACDNFKIPCILIGVGNHYENNPYSISKTTAEKYGLMYAKYFNTPVNVVRAYNAIGPRQKWGKVHKILPTFINAGLRGEPIKVYGGRDKCSIMDLVYAGDIAKVLIDVLEKTSEDFGHVYEAGTGVGLPVWQIAELVNTFCGKDSKIVEIPMRSGETENSICVARHPYPIEYREISDVIFDSTEYYKELM